MLVIGRSFYKKTGEEAETAGEAETEEEAATKVMGSIGTK